MLQINCTCGEIYKADKSHIGKKIQCKKCHEILEIKDREPSKKTETSSEKSHRPSGFHATTTSKDIKDLFSSKDLLRLLVSAAFIIALIFIGVYAQDNSPSAPQEKEAPYMPQSEEELIRMTLEANPNRLKLGDAPFGKGLNRGQSRFTVDNGSSTDTIVKLMRIKSDNHKELVRNFYIPAKMKFAADNIPAGDYIVKTSSGLDWNTQTKKFNKLNSYGQTEQFKIEETRWNEETPEGTIVHTKASDMSITLHKVPFGNFNSFPITEEEFEKEE